MIHLTKKHESNDILMILNELVPLQLSFILCCINVTLLDTLLLSFLPYGYSIGSFMLHQGYPIGPFAIIIPSTGMSLVRSCCTNNIPLNQRNLSKSISLKIMNPMIYWYPCCTNVTLLDPLLLSFLPHGYSIYQYQRNSLIFLCIIIDSIDFCLLSWSIHAASMVYSTCSYHSFIPCSFHATAGSPFPCFGNFSDILPRTRQPGETWQFLSLIRNKHVTSDFNK